VFSRLKLLLAETIRQWGRDRAPLLAAALSFYALFSLAPLALVTLGLTGMFLGSDAAQRQLDAEVARLAGPLAAEAVRSLIEAASQADSGALPTAVGIVLLVASASIVFAQLHSALNVIWDVHPEPAKGKTSLRIRAAVGAWAMRRLLSFGLVFAAGAFFVTSIVFSSAISATVGYVDSVTPFQVAAYNLSDLLASLLLSTIIFGAIFKVVPDAHVEWRDVRTGAFATSVMFNLGKIGISSYLGQSAVATAYGAAGSLVVILLWVFYASLIFLFGAEFTQVLSDRDGMRAARKYSSSVA
jgi:membrane protein